VLVSSKGYPPPYVSGRHLVAASVSRGISAQPVCRLSLRGLIENVKCDTVRYGSTDVMLLPRHILHHNTLLWTFMLFMRTTPDSSAASVPRGGVHSASAASRSCWRSRRKALSADVRSVSSLSHFLTPKLRSLDSALVIQSHNRNLALSANWHAGGGFLQCLNARQLALICRRATFLRFP